MNIINNSNFWYFFPSLFFCLLIPALVSGPFLPDLFLSLIALFGLFLFLKKKDFKILKHPFFIFFIFFYFYILISSFFSTNIINSLSVSLFYFRYLFFIIGSMYILKKNEYLINYFFYSLFITFLFVSSDALYQLINGKNILGFVKHGDRLSGLFGDEFILGSFLSRLFPLLVGLIIYLYAKPKNLFVYILFLIFFILIDILVFFSGERAAFFYITLSTFLMIILLTNFKIIRFISIIITALFIILYGKINDQMNNRMFTQTFEDLGISSQNSEIQPNVYSSKYKSMFLTALNMFEDNIIFGQGPNSFEVLCEEKKFHVNDGCSTSPHNNYLQLLAESGIIGFIPFFVLFCFFSYLFFKHFYRKIFNHKNNLNDYQICLLICVFISLFPFIPTSNFYNNWLNVIYYLPVCFIIYNQNKSIDTK